MARTQNDRNRSRDDLNVAQPTMHSVEVLLDEEQLAAVEGWRSANLIPTRPEALRELVRLGLLSEIAKIHQLVSDIRASVDNHRLRSDLSD